MSWYNELASGDDIKDTLGSFSKNYFLEKSKLTC